jgi:hypothetical protein
MPTQVGIISSEIYYLLIVINILAVLEFELKLHAPAMPLILEILVFFKLGISKFCLTL